MMSERKQLQGVINVKEEKKKIVCDIFLNVLVVATECYALSVNFNENGPSMFRFYTELSNALALVACALTAVFAFLKLFGKKIPTVVSAIKFTATVSQTITFFVVVFILAPQYGGIEGYKSVLFYGTMIFTHLLCPLLTFVSFCFFEKSFFPVSVAFFAVVPTIIYGAVALALNFFRIMVGPYPFLEVYRSPVITAVVCPIVFAASFFLALVVRGVNHRNAEK